MADVLVDSSVWIEYFRSGEGDLFDLVDGLLDERRVVLCGMVELEILQGIRPAERPTIKSLFSALDFVETVRSDYVAAGEQLNELRRTGITIPSSDALIGAVCVRNGLALLTTDRHFDHLAEIRRAG